MTTQLTTSQLAELLGKKVWSGNGQERIYFNNVGYNTKKMSTKAFIYIQDGEIKASAFVQCFNQPTSWCQQRAEEAKETMLEQVADVLNPETISE